MAGRFILFVVVYLLCLYIPYILIIIATLTIGHFFFFLYLCVFIFLVDKKYVNFYTYVFANDCMLFYVFVLKFIHHSFILIIIATLTIGHFFFFLYLCVFIFLVDKKYVNFYTYVFANDCMLFYVFVLKFIHHSF
eukprot:197621_1